MSQFEGFPISPQQKQGWRLYKRHGLSRMALALLWRGELKRDDLKQSIRCMVNRHEIFRTHFVTPAGLRNPYQVIAERALFDWRELTLSGDLDLLWRRFLREELEAPHQWDQGPQLRVTLVRTAERRYLLVISLPTLCGDSRTLENMAQEIVRFYRHPGPVENIDDGPVQYTQFSEWLTELADEEEGGLSFWVEKAKSMPHMEQTDAGQPFRPNFVSVDVDHVDTDILHSSARSLGCSIRNYLATCWHVFLGRRHNLPSLTMATAFDGRTFEELLPSFGSFSRFLPVHTALDDNRSFRDMLSLIAAQTEENEQWQDYFDLEEIGLSETWPFAFEYAPKPASFQLENLVVSTFARFHCEAPFTIKLTVLHTEGAPPRFVCFYNQNQHSRGEIEMWLAGFRQLYLDAARRPDAVINTLTILSPSERRRVLHEMNDTMEPCPFTEPIHRLFEKQARLAPSKRALVFSREERKGSSLNEPAASPPMTYRTLNIEANRLAHLLRARGVVRETPVAILMDRSPDQIVALLAVLKAGAAYLPFDPSLPSSRLALMLSACKLLITHQYMAVPETDVPAICLSRDRAERDQYPSDNLATATVPDALAYIVFTSGSTGNPRASWSPTGIYAITSAAFRNASRLVVLFLTPWFPRSPRISAIR